MKMRMEVGTALAPLLSLFLLQSQAEIVSVSVPEILAQKTTEAVDPNLNAALVARLKTAFKYTGYRLIKNHEVKTALDGKEKLKLSEGYSLRLVTFRKENTLKIEVSIHKGAKGVLGPTTIVPGRSPTVVRAGKLKNGDLLLAIMIKN